MHDAEWPLRTFKWGAAEWANINHRVNKPAAPLNPLEKTLSTPEPLPHRCDNSRRRLRAAQLFTFICHINLLPTITQPFRGELGWAKLSWTETKWRYPKCSYKFTKNKNNNKAQRQMNKMGVCCTRASKVWVPWLYYNLTWEMGILSSVSIS